MSEPLMSSGAVTSVITGITFIGLLSGIDAGAVVGAFAGSVLFVISAPDFTIRTRLILFVVSLIAGVLSADFMSDIITAITPTEVSAQRPLGALVSSAIAVRLLMFMGVQATNPISIIDKFKGGPHG